MIDQILRPKANSEPMVMGGLALKLWQQCEQDADAIYKRLGMKRCPRGDLIVILSLNAAGKWEYFADCPNIDHANAIGEDKRFAGMELVAVGYTSSPRKPAPLFAPIQSELNL